MDGQGTEKKLVVHASMEKNSRSISYKLSVENAPDVDTAISILRDGMGKLRAEAQNMLAEEK